MIEPPNVSPHTAPVPVTGNDCGVEVTKKSSVGTAPARDG